MDIKRIIILRPITQFLVAHVACNIIPVIIARIEVEACLCEGVGGRLETRGVWPFEGDRGGRFRGRVFYASGL